MGRVDEWPRALLAPEPARGYAGRFFVDARASESVSRDLLETGVYWK